MTGIYPTPILDKASETQVNNILIVMSLLFIKAHLLNPASRNVHNIPLSWESLYNHLDKRYET